MSRTARLLIIAGLAAGAFFLCKAYVAEPFYVASASMEPTLNIGDHLILDKLTFLFRPPQRGDIVAFRDPEGKHELEFVKRVIGVPGETVSLRQKQVFINGNKLSEPYTQYTRLEEKLQGDNLSPVTVPARSLFVLGDNRDESGDSLSWKDPKTGERILFIGLDAVSGKVRGAFRDHQ